MMIRLTVAGAMLLVGSAARAASATPEEAQRLTGVFETYVGHGSAGRPGAVTVVPHGEGYTATLDITRLLAMTATLGFDVTAGDLVAELTPQADGQWHVTVAGLPPLGFSKDATSMSIAVKNYSFDGSFDPKLQAFSASTSAMRGSTTHMTGKDGPVDVTMTSESAGTTKATEAGPGLIDVTTATTAKDLDYRFVQGPAGAALDSPKAPIDLAHITAGTLASSLSLRHERVAALDDLWQFLVAHPSAAELRASQAELKARLHAVVPLATSATGSVAASNVTTTTRLGAFGLATFGERYAINDGDKGGDTLGLQFTGLTLPDRLVPPWAVPLVPVALDYTQMSSPVHLTEALSMMIDDLDLSAETPLTPAQRDAIAQAFGTDHMTITVAPSSIATALMTLKVQGEARIDKPAFGFSGLVTGTGLDKTMEAVRAAAPNDPAGAQAIAMLTAAKALGRAEGPDSYSWRVEMSQAGAVTINGTSLGDVGASPRAKPKPRKTSDPQ